MKKQDPPDPTAYGGQLLKKRKARKRARPLDTKNTMHLVLRSTQAVGAWSFSKKPNQKKIEQVLAKFSEKYSVHILSMANVGNHLHFHMKIASRVTYYKFIRAITSAIVMMIAGVNKFKKLKKTFWDVRPFTKIVFGENGKKTMQRYIEINQLEGQGWNRAEAMQIIANYSGQYF